MRILITVGAVTLLDLRLLEPDDDEEEEAPGEDVDVKAARVTVLDSIVHDRDDGPAPFGFRPRVVPWPPDWDDR